MGIKFQLVPIGNHQEEKLEQSIQMFKAQFITGICSVNPQFPLQDWDNIVEQATIILNMMHVSRENPSISKYMNIFGLFNYNVMPLVLTGTKVVAHNKT